MTILIILLTGAFFIGKTNNKEIHKKKLRKLENKVNELAKEEENQSLIIFSLEDRIDSLKQLLILKENEILYLKNKPIEKSKK